MSLIGDVLDRLLGLKMFPTLDMNGFFHLPNDEESSTQLLRVCFASGPGS